MVRTNVNAQEKNVRRPIGHRLGAPPLRTRAEDVAVHLRLEIGSTMVGVSSTVVIWLSVSRPSLGFAQTCSAYIAFKVNASQLSLIRFRCFAAISFDVNAFAVISFDVNASHSAYITFNDYASHTPPATHTNSLTMHYQFNTTPHAQTTSHSFGTMS